MESPASLNPKLIVGFNGPKASKWLLDALAKRLLAGVILFERNIQDRSQVQALTKSLKAARSDVVIAIDQEGGHVSRLPWLSIPPACELGKLSVAETVAAAQTIATELAKLGITLNFAPVIDLSITSDNFISQRGRCYGATSQVVVEHARCVVDAHRAAGIRTVLKHFPGHGSSVSDSHLAPADISQTWSEEELVPYRSLIESGHADAIMLAHVQHQLLSAKEPASLSAKVVNFLRNDLNYQGTLISDDLDMKAISGKYSLPVAMRLGEQIGLDLMIAGHSFAGGPGRPATAAG